MTRFLNFMLALGGSLLFSCGGTEGKDPDPQPAPPVDKSEISTIKVLPGRKRMKLSWVLKPDARVTKVKVYWNNKADSAEVGVKTQTGPDTMQVVLTNLTEGNHTFRLFTSDGKHAPTYKLNVSGRVYGDTYASSLQARGIKSTTISKETNLIDWQNPVAQVVGVQIQYLDNTGALRKLVVPGNAATTLLDKYKPGTYFDYRTLYLPEPNALDTFFTGYTSSRGALVYRSLVTKLIADKSNLVKTVLADTLLQLHPGVEQTNLHYEGQDGRLITLYVVAADLTQPGVALRATTPNNSATFTRQTVSEMARLADAPGNRVVAAVNGDFYTNNVPQGVVVKGGVILKEASRADASYFGMLKNGSPVIGTYDHFLINKNNMQEAIGAYHRLVNDGVKVPQGDLSVEPRTIIGFTSDKKIYLVAIDGRQQGYSLGMSFAQCSAVLMALGVQDGINLDGGGSTTLVTKDKVANTFKVVNKPSDGSQRTVINAWSVVATQ